MVAKILNRINWIQKTMQHKEQVLLLRGEEIKTVKEALEKQEKVKPIIIDDAEDSFEIEWECPVCGSHHGASYTPGYCMSCGKAIDWSGT